MLLGLLINMAYRIIGTVFIIVGIIIITVENFVNLSWNVPKNIEIRDMMELLHYG